MWVKITEHNVPSGEWINTSIHQNGDIRNEQVMKFERGLWWTRDGMYTYYSPTHFLEQVMTEYCFMCKKFTLRHNGVFCVNCGFK